jgi:alanine racemase
MKLNLSTSELTSIVKGEISEGSSSNVIHFICTDTRHTIDAAHALFIPLKGEHFNGHAFISAAYDNGIRTFIVSEAVDLPCECTVIRVENTTEAFQKIAAHHRQQFNIPVIGITGSNGKTIVKEWINQLLSDDYCIARSPKSFNSQIGVPLAVLQLEEMHNLGIFEAGISLPNEMNALQKIIQPTTGVFTFLGSAHAENFQSQEELLQEKMKLFSTCETLIAPSGIDIDFNGKFIRVGKESNDDFSIKKISSSSSHSIISFSWKGEFADAEIPFTDNISLNNFALAAATALQFGLSLNQLSEKAPQLLPLEMRMQQIKGIGGMQLLNDGYSNDLTSLKLALQHFKLNIQASNRGVILSDILESGMNDEIWISRVCELMNEFQIDEVYSVGERFLQHKNILPHTFQCFENTEALIEFLLSHKIESSALLIKGARKFQFEKIVNALQEQHQETIFEVNMNALANNYYYFRSLLNPEVKLMGMVKANGYGIGAVEVATCLANCGIDALAVAYTDEGVELREAGISLPILVLEPNVTDFAPVFKHRLEPELFSIRSFKAFVKAATEFNSEKKFKAHLKLDTGMNRLGFKHDETSELIQLLLEHSNIEIASIFTHFAASEDESHDAFTQNQITDFENRCKLISEALGYTPVLHAANTGGIQRWKNAQFNMVRLGIGLYGVSAFEEEQKKLRNVGSLKTSIVQIKSVLPNETVGYGRTFTSNQEMKIAVLPIGYADGFRRSLSNGKGKVFINGNACPVVGRVCMDVTMVDITGVPALEGDEAIVFNGEHSILDYAKDCDTIAYEVLTSIPQRVKRIIVNEA